MKPTRGTIAVLAAFCTLVWWTQTADVSAQSRALSTQELAVRSDVVAIGTVAGMNCEWSSDKTRIVTRVTIAVREFLKGGVGEQELTIVTPGGEIGDVGELYCGAARFHMEEEVVVFAKKGEGATMNVAGGATGKFTIERDRITQAMMVAPGISLQDLRAQVKTAIQAPVPEEK